MFLSLSCRRSCARSFIGLQEAKEDAEKTPLQQKLDEFGNALTWIIGVICVAVSRSSLRRLYIYMYVCINNYMFRVFSDDKSHRPSSQTYRFCAVPSGIVVLYSSGRGETCASMLMMAFNVLF